MLMLWLCLAFWAVPTAAIECEQGVGPEASEIISPSITRLNLDAPEEVLWFWNTHAREGKRPVLFETNKLTLHNDNLNLWTTKYLQKKLKSKLLTVVEGPQFSMVNPSTVQLTFEEFSAKKSASSMIRTALPEAIADDFPLQ
jgi:hypothetical protein